MEFAESFEGGLPNVRARTGGLGLLEVFAPSPRVNVNKFPAPSCLATAASHRALRRDSKPPDHLNDTIAASGTAFKPVKILQVLKQPLVMRSKSKRIVIGARETPPQLEERVEQTDSNLLVVSEYRKDKVMKIVHINSIPSWFTAPEKIRMKRRSQSRRAG